MGYRRPPIKLVFEAAELEGLEVRARRLSVSELDQLINMPDHLTRPERDNIAFEVLLAVLKGWNLEDEQGQPVPLTMDGLRSTDRALVNSIADELITASTRVAPPLPRRSDDGSPSGEEWELMESLTSSTGPS